jgi:hypothetical protein
MKALRPTTWIVLLLLSMSFTERLSAALNVDAPRYGTQRAVVIGINYSAVASDAPVSKLRFAEDDAQEFGKRLTDWYGFQPVTLLLGKQATRGAIVKALEELYAADENDCVIVYFSGHGFGREVKQNEPPQGELLAADVQFKNGLPTAENVIQMDSISDQLGKFCKARHKLLIFDCCHSGAIFSRSGRGASVFDASRIDDSVFSARGFQAMTASRDQQKAGDGKD